jgi:hypothetical protein
VGVGAGQEFAVSFWVWVLIGLWGFPLVSKYVQAWTEKAA